ncbi:MAG: LysR family transcriptional regulator [Myxococcota bacterium]
MATPTPIAGVDLNLLTSLDALLETGSVTHAAKRVGVTQSAMSRTLGRLRVVLNDSLFLRQGRTLVPTARALALREPLQDLFALLEHRILAKPDFDPEASERAFRIVGADIMDLTLVPTIFRALRREAPYATLQVLRVTPEADPPDLVFAPGPQHQNVPVLNTLRRAPLFIHRFTTLVRDDHPVLARPWNLDQFLELDHVLVAPLGGTDGLVDRLLAERGLRRKIALWTTDFANLGPLLEQTDLVASLPDTQARFLRAHFAVRELQAPIELPDTPVYMYWLPRDDEDPGHRWFRDLVQRCICGDAR